MPLLMFIYSPQASQDKWLTLISLFSHKFFSTTSNTIIMKEWHYIKDWKGGKKQKHDMVNYFYWLELIYYQRKLSFGLWYLLIFSQQDKFDFTLWHDFVLSFFFLSFFLYYFKKLEYSLFPLFSPPVLISLNLLLL